MAALLKILTALASVIPAVLSWWRGRQAKREQAAVQARADAIRADPAPEWMRKFGEQSGPGGAPNAHQAGADEHHPNA